MTQRQQSLYAYLMHVSQGGSQLYILTLFLSVPFCIYHRRFTAGIKGYSTLTGNVHARHLSPRLVSSRPTQFPCTHCKKFCQFHLVSRQSSPVCSVSVLCHSVHIHSSNAHTLAAQHCMQAYSAPRWQLQWLEEYRRRRYSRESDTRLSGLHKAWRRPKLPFSVSLRISTVTVYYHYNLPSATKTRSSSLAGSTRQHWVA